MSKGDLGDEGNLHSNRFVRVSVNWKALSLIENKGKLTSGVCCHQQIVLIGTESDLLRRLPEKKFAGLFLSKLSETMNRRIGY